MPLRPRVLVTLLLLALLLITLATRRAEGQIEQRSLRLNTPVFSSQYLSVFPTTGLIDDNYTIEAWVRPTSYAGPPTIVGNDFEESVWVGLNTTGHVRFYPVGQVFVESDGIVPLNEWTHVAVTYEAANGWSIYLDGTLDSQSGSISGPVGTGPPDLRIGADRSLGAAAFFWRGWLDEVRIWTAARTGSQIRQTMYAGAGRPAVETGVYDALEGWWDMQEPSAAGVFDRASGGAHPDHFADFVNVANVDVQAPPVAYNVALQLNGTDDFAVIPLLQITYEFGVTIEAWIAPTSYQGFPTIVGRGYTESFWLGLNGIGRLRFYPTGGIGNYLEGLTTIPLDTWTHVAATYRDGVSRLYVNGELDLESTAITGLIGGANAIPFAGADNNGDDVLHFQGFLDEVRVTRGALSAATIQAEMFRGYGGGGLTFVHDELGASRERRHACMDGIAPNSIQGTSARMVRSGAPIASSASNLFDAPLATFTSRILGGATTFLPDLYLAPNVADEVYYPTPLGITDVDAFVVAGTHHLDAVRVRLRSPEGTWIDLVTPGQATGRDLHTLFDDQAPLSLAAAIPPYVHGVRPSQSFSAFDGENSEGLWRLEVVDESASPLGVELWAWGLRVEGGVLDVTAGSPWTVALRNAGANPVRGTGRLAFALASEAHVRLGLYDVQGREVRTLIADRRGAGDHLLGWNAAGLESGLYFARLRVDGRELAPIRVTVLQ